MSLCIGHFLLVTEPDGSVTVYDESLSEEEIEQREEDGDDPWVFSGSMRDARAFVYDELGEPDPDLDPDEPCERVAQSKPCGECPFRRKAAPGWLGASDPEGFVGTMITEREPLPCHSTINYERDDWHEQWLASSNPRHKLCAGALTLMANEGKRPRTGPSKDRDTKAVFASYREFVEHHRGSSVQSWTDPAPGTAERAGLDWVRDRLKLPTLK
jgi:hypothetical protein